MGQPPGEAGAELEATVGNLERLCGRLEQAEQHFKRLTDECESVLQGLVAVDRRHSSAIASLNERLGDWCNLEGKLLEESSRRIERFERGVSHEWMVLRRLNEEPIAELREQAEALRRACLEAARIGRMRLEAGRDAQASQPDEIERRLAEWTRELLQAQRQPAEGPVSDGAAAAASVEPWSLESVAQIHQEMRAGAPAPPDRLQAPANGKPVMEVQAAPAAERPKGEDLSSASEEPLPPNGEDPPASRRRWTIWAAALGGVALAAFLGFLVFTSGGPGVPAASARPTPAHPAEDTPLAPAPEEPDPRLVEAQRAAERAAVMVEILAAPDLRRYALGGLGPTPAAYAQVLWSRTRGLALTASRLPAPPAGTTYRVWIRSVSGLGAAGVLVPDATGRASLVLPGPLRLPQPGAIRVMLEPEAASARPSGEACLAGGTIE